jgi:anaerobic ribonucleoside-triphosphate reductase activating protein
MTEGLLRIARVAHGSTAEGPRRNTTFWVSGCSLRCPGCFNPELFDDSAGRAWSGAEILTTVAVGLQEGDTGAAFVGGEPTEQPVGLLAALVALRLRFPRLVLTVYSGRTYESLVHDETIACALGAADFLVDGPFVQRLAHPNLGYRGSANQRVIDLGETRRRGELAQADWDNRIAVLGDGQVAVPPALAELFPGAQTGRTSECGRFEAAGHG